MLRCGICAIKAVARGARRRVRIESDSGVIYQLTMKDQTTWISFAVTANHDDDDMVCYEGELGDDSCVFEPSGDCIFEVLLGGSRK